MLGKGFVEGYLELSHEKDSFLCVGIDPATGEMREKNRIPDQLIELMGEEKGIREFCIEIIRAVSPYTPIIKPNAHFLLYRLGYDAIRGIVEEIHRGRCKALLDVKLSDIGSTMDSALFWIERLGFDAITFSPFPGYENGVDAVYNWAREMDKGIFCLTRMSNPGTHDYQSKHLEGEPFYRRIARDAAERGCNGFVVGCTADEELGAVRDIIGEDRLILAPGLGAQGGDPGRALKLGANDIGEGIIVSSSRSIDYAYERLGWEWRRYAEAAEVTADRKRRELNEIKEDVLR
ncbi:MAG: orotidine-5'-phosphate decarboxylase [Candidatus Bathyarchaeia archaeon]